MGVGTNFTPPLCVVDKATKKINLFCVGGEGNILIESGEVSESVNDSDDLLFFRSNESVRVAVDDFTQYILAENIREVSATTTFALKDSTILCNTGTYTVTLPPIATVLIGKKYTIKRIGSSGVITFKGDGSEVIDNLTSIDISGSMVGYTAQTDGSKWWVV